LAGNQHYLQEIINLAPKLLHMQGWLTESLGTVLAGAEGRKAGPRMRGLRLYLFLRSVAELSVTAVGGPQAHLVVFRRVLVERFPFITTEELLELNALSQMLPGPTSTQTLTAIAYRIGGPLLAYATLLIWVLPSVVMMSLAAVLVSRISATGLSASLMQFAEPAAVGLVAHAAISFAQKTILGNIDAALMAITAGLMYYFPSPYLAPVLLAAGGLVTSLLFRQEKSISPLEAMRIPWANFWLWVAVFVGAAVAGNVTQSLPALLFENFYRNGSLIFGGGQVLIPLLYNEFVEFKQYLSAEEFLFGYALVQTLPGPVFAFCSYIGLLAVRTMGPGYGWTGATAATLGIFLPGTFLIFFVIRIWDQLKRYPMVRASLEGVNAVSAGLIFAASLLMFKPIEASQLNIGIIGGTFLLLQFTRVPSWAIIAFALVSGLVIG
jgi:chromate transporter